MLKSCHSWLLCKYLFWYWTICFSFLYLAGKPNTESIVICTFAVLSNAYCLLCLWQRHICFPKAEVKFQGYFSMLDCYICLCFSPVCYSQSNNLISGRGSRLQTQSNSAGKPQSVCHVSVNSKPAS